MLICNCVHCISSKICTWNPSASEQGLFLLSLYSFHTYHFPFGKCKVVLKHHQKCTKRACCHPLLWEAGWIRQFSSQQKCVLMVKWPANTIWLSLKLMGIRSQTCLTIDRMTLSKKVCLGRKKDTTNSKMPQIFFPCFPCLCFSKNYFKKFSWSITFEVFPFPTFF